MASHDDQDLKLKRVCYLTGRRLKNPEEAYKDYLEKNFHDANGLPIVDAGEPLPRGKAPLDPDVESLEHIIPNGIGGKLKSRNILSHTGNKQLNEKIDIEFVNTFASFTSRLSVHKDRNSKPSMSAFHLDHGVEVVFKDNKYFPAKPYFDKESRTIYAYPLRNAENYKKYLIKMGVISADDEIKLADDMAGNIEMPLGLGNKNFKQGMAKIAIGYASLHGIPREKLTEVLNVHDNEILEKISLIASFPISKSELFFEENVVNSSHYPCHTLTLCGHERLLYCHIELFNAFQWYVLLNEDYQGANIYHTYTYDLLNDQEISREKYIASVKIPDELPPIKDFRKVPEEMLRAIARKTSEDKENLKDYNHFKFYQLSDFARQQFIRNKAIALGLIELKKES